MKIALINCFDTYGERATCIYEYFTSKGYEVSVIVSDFKHFEKKRFHNDGDEYVQIKVPEYKRNLSIARLKSHIFFAKQAIKEIEKLQPQIVYALIPPNALVKELTLYRMRQQNIKIIYDIIDLWPETMPIRFWKKYFPFTIWKNLRDKYISNSDYVITECDLYQNMLCKVLDRTKHSTLYLVRKDEYCTYPYFPRETLDVCYLGSVNNIIDINTIYKTLKKLTVQHRVNFHIIGGGENKSKLMKKINQLELQVIDYGLVYDKKEKMKIFSNCDFGINIMKKSVCVGLTMKSIDYFEAGIPIINNIQGDTYEFVEKYGVGVNLDSKGNIDLERVNEIKKGMNKVRERVRILYRENFLYDVFSSKMDKILREIL